VGISVQSSLFDGAVHVAANASALAVLAAGGSMVLKGDMTSGQLASFMMYSLFVAGSSGALSETYRELMKSLAAAERVFNVIYTEPEMNEGEINTFDANSASIEMRNVSFNYPTRPDIAVLKDCNLLIEPGMHVALVGASGSGKSTLAALISRTYDVDEGSIAIAGIDVKDYTYGALRGAVGVVEQEPLLFTGTIGENIAMGACNDQSVNESDIEEAARGTK